MTMTEHPCPECGGRLALACGIGRFRRYRGEDGYEIPARMKIPTCTRCGEMWLNSMQVRELGAIFEAARIKRRECPDWLPSPVGGMSAQRFFVRSPDSVTAGRGNAPPVAIDLQSTRVLRQFASAVAVANVSAVCL